MKAVLCNTHGLPNSLVVEDIASPVAGDNEVVVTVKACGVNFPDTLIIQGKYQFKPPLPFSPGAEVSGIVKSVGASVANVKVGDAVVAFCGWGGFAEELKCDASQLIPLPPGTPFPLAASFVLAYGTSYHALKDRAAIKAGETLLVLGAAGGVGLAAVELGKALGARVIAAASTAEKLAVCKAHGADELIDYTTQDLREQLKALTNARGVDVIYDPVGGALAEPALRSMAWKGRYLVVGFASGEIPSMPLNLTLLKGSSIVGVFWGAHVKNEPAVNATNLRELFGMLRSGKIKPLISQTYPLDRAADALNDVMNRKVMGKVVLVTG